MHASMPPYTQADKARQMYEETSAIAAAQDAKLDPISDVEARVRTALSHLHHAQLLLKEVFPEPRARSPKWSPDWLAEQGTHATSPYLASFSPNEFRDEALQAIGIGDVESRHPMHAEVLRDEYERADKETGV